MAKNLRCKVLEKLISAGFTTNKKIAKLRLKDAAQMSDLSKDEMQTIAEFQEKIMSFKSVNAFLEFLSYKDEEV